MLQATFVSNKASVNSNPPTEIYRIGAGDVLSINLKNAGNASGYYTVRPNGTIDFPLAGKDLAVAGQTIGEAEETVAAAITLYNDPQVAIKIREYASHKITVSGLVERPGERSIQREAVPLYVVRAEAGVLSNATMVLIRRSDLGKIETFDLHSADIDAVLLYPGNFIEFTDGQKSVLGSSGFYYIAGAVNSSGQKEFTAGLTLFQAVIASGGTKGNPKKASVRRKDEKGTLKLAEYNLRTIKEGKATDPALFPGDMIEIGN
jgi:protein involved in polysaccharide export with SLBB domain